MTNNINPYKRHVFIFWTLFCLPFILLLILFTAILNGHLGFMPAFEDLENPKSYQASNVFSGDGQIIGNFYYQNRSSIDFKDLSPNIVKAIIAIEDIRFEKHSGIDERGLIRVLFKTLLMGIHESGGGSTITQQLAKNLFGRDTSDYSNALMNKAKLAITKFKEWITAVQLEKNYTKKEILVMYLNTVFFGSNAYGIKAAAETYFNTTPDSLKIEEAALLAGIINAPTRFNPVTNPGRSIQRRNIVLAQMMKYQFITRKEFDSLVFIPIRLRYKVSDENEGLAPYLREYIRVTMTAEKPQRKNYFDIHSFFRDSLEWENNPLYGWTHKNKKPDGKPYDLYRDGLRIHTTIHSAIQRYAEEACKEHISIYLQKEFFAEKKGRKIAPFSDDLTTEQIQAILQQAMTGSRRYKLLRQKGISPDSINKNFKKPVRMKIYTWSGERDTFLSPWDSIRYYKHILRFGFIALEPYTGEVKAWVGGPSFKYFKYDGVKTSRRQVGSTIKPFLYTLAMQEGYSPCYEVPNVAQTFQMGDTIWTPKNSDISGKEGQMVTLRWGLANSVNYISAWLVKQFNPVAVVDIMRKMGITGYLPAVPSLILGTPEISLYEMTAAYTTFPNKGVFIAPFVVSRIEDRTGTVITRFHPQKKEAISEQTAYLMINMMQGVVNSGTAVRLRYKYNFTNEIAGKTGTTQNQSDGWFIGCTPKLTAGVWTGGELRAIHFDGIAMGQGASTALPVFALFMKKIYADTSLHISVTDVFERPDNFNVNTNCIDVYQNQYNEDDLILE